eukprot:4765344-Pleurochrysis_carterae.AAC.1
MEEGRTRDYPVEGVQWSGGEEGGGGGGSLSFFVEHGVRLEHGAELADLSTREASVRRDGSQPVGPLAACARPPQLCRYTVNAEQLLREYEREVSGGVGGRTGRRMGGREGRRMGGRVGGRMGVEKQRPGLVSRGNESVGVTFGRLSSVAWDAKDQRAGLGLRAGEGSTALAGARAQRGRRAAKTATAAGELAEAKEKEK